MMVMPTMPHSMAYLMPHEHLPRCAECELWAGHLGHHAHQIPHGFVNCSGCSASINLNVEYPLWYSFHRPECTLWATPTELQVAALARANAALAEADRLFGFVRSVRAR